MASRRSRTSKKYWLGTHRIATPSATFERFGRCAAQLGVTRLANVTGLDYLGIPVFMAARPNARSLSVSQGKGLDEDGAAASALMEAAELDHAERVRPPRSSWSYKALSSRAKVANPRLLPRAGQGRFPADRAIPWIEGREISSGEAIWVPFELVHLDYTLPARPGAGLFAPGSNGLASGNHEVEAICAALCEVIERDATRLWRLRQSSERAGRRLALDGVRDPDGRILLDRLANRGMAVSIWDVTTDLAVACFLCRVREMPDNDRSKLGAFWGSGCHLDRNVALIRAMTEAVQSRLTYIAGARDDLRRRDYLESGKQALADLALDLREQQNSGRCFADVPSATNADLVTDRDYLLERLRSAGLEQVIAIDLTNERFGIPVVRVIVPGLETDDERSRDRPVRSARLLANSLQ